MNLRTLLPLLALFLSLPWLHAQDKTAPAVEAARAWLALVDAGEYAKSWKETAPLFQEKVKEADWVKMVAAVRDPLGAVSKRTQIAAQYATFLPGAPEGEYVVIQFLTDFAKKTGAVETVTPMKDPAGNWKVSGYYIK